MFEHNTWRHSFQIPGLTLLRPPPPPPPAPASPQPRSLCYGNSCSDVKFCLFVRQKYAAPMHIADSNRAWQLWLIYPTTVVKLATDVVATAGNAALHVAATSLVDEWTAKVWERGKQERGRADTRQPTPPKFSRLFNQVTLYNTLWRNQVWQQRQVSSMHVNVHASKPHACTRHTCIELLT